MKPASHLTAFLFVFILCSFGTSAVLATDQSHDIEQILVRLVNEQRESAGLVGLGAILIHDGQIIGPSVSGERKKGSRVLLTNSDQWHVGSITKSITATMIARLVERGTLSWDTTINDVFKGVEGINAEWQNATLSQLLTHTSGAAPNFPFLINLQNPAAGVERMTARENAVLAVFKKAPQSVPGNAFTYSNVGYTVAGVMVEKVTGLPWEQLVDREIFQSLNLASGGFGPPQDQHTALEQPRGHRKWFGFTIASSTADDNTPILGPAATVHLSLKDLAMYGHEHLLGYKGQGTLLKAETYQLLHTPVLKNYAYGWSVSTPKDIGAGKILWHNGSNTRWYALLAILPSYNAVVAVTTNDGNFDVAEKSAREIISQVVQSLSNETLD